MFCQSCGSENSADARFCNMCGTPIAAPGTPAGPLEPSAGGEQAAAPSRANMPVMGSNTTGITLARIGVQSTGRAWGTVAGIALGLVALGSVATWFVMRGGDGDGSLEGAAEGGTGSAQADDPFVLGTPLPTGVEPPPDEGFVAPGAEGAPGAGESAEGEGAEGEGQGAGAGKTGRSVRRRPAPPPTTTVAVGGSGGDGTGASGSGSRGEGAGATGSAGEGAGASGSGSTGEGEVEVPEDRDIAMELYGARVRFVIRRYYAQRAQSCFDRATRNNPGLRGTVVVGLRVGASGQIERAQVARNTTGDDALGACLAGQVRTWKLPPPPGGPEDMELPFSR